MIPRTIVVNVALGILILVFAGSLYSKELDGSSRIKITGNVAEGVSKRITVKEIESTGISEAELFDPFDKKKSSFTGVMLTEFVKKFGKQAVTRVIFTAVDDYEITFTQSEWNTERILLVTRIENKYFDLEQRGPLRIVYPDYDPKKDDSKEVMPKWIWMIKTINLQ